TSGLVADEYCSGSPPARMLSDIEIEHHVMQTAKRPFVVNEVTIVCELQDIAHRRSVSLHCRPSSTISIKRILAFDSRDCVFVRNVVSFNGVGALNCSGKG